MARQDIERLKRYIKSIILIKEWGLKRMKSKKVIIKWEKIIIYLYGMFSVYCMIHHAKLNSGFYQFQLLEVCQYVIMGAGIYYTARSMRRGDFWNV